VYSCSQQKIIFWISTLNMYELESLLFLPVHLRTGRSKEANGTACTEYRILSRPMDLNQVFFFRDISVSNCRLFVSVFVCPMVQLRISIIYSHMQTVRLRETHVIAGCIVSVPFNSTINNIDTNCAQTCASTERGAARLISVVVLTVPVLRVVLRDISVVVLTVPVLSVVLRDSYR
jgi:hypothetical protein